jgi:hypothetical protein
MLAQEYAIDTSLLQEVTRAARGVRILVEILERHPEMLIRGKTEGKP